MYSLIEKGIISDRNCVNNFECILADKSIFSATDYKVLQSQDDGIFIKCLKMTRNGKIDLLYLTEDYKPFSSMFEKIETDTFINVILNLFAGIIEVKNNGFLSYRCLDLSWDKIYVEANTLKVKLVYRPLNLTSDMGFLEFESELRSRIVRLINDVIKQTNDRLISFVPDLCNGSMTLEDVYNKAKNTGMIQLANNTRSNETAGTPNAIRLVALNSDGHFELLIDKSNVSIGKKQELVDLVIPFNRMISRKHCRIIKTGEFYYISDEGSSNGTYVNGNQVDIGQQVRIKRGDIVRLADSEFQVI